MGDESSPQKAPEAAPLPDASPLPEGEASDSIFGEFLLFLKEEKKWWLAPLVVVLLALSAIIMFAEGSAIAPFIYTIF
jgi:hypothetical protein